MPARGWPVPFHSPPSASQFHRFRSSAAGSKSSLFLQSSKLVGIRILWENAQLTIVTCAVSVFVLSAIKLPQLLLLSQSSGSQFLHNDLQTRPLRPSPVSRDSRHFGFLPAPYLHSHCSCSKRCAQRCM